MHYNQPTLNQRILNRPETYTTRSKNLITYQQFGGFGCFRVQSKGMNTIFHFFSTTCSSIGDEKVWKWQVEARDTHYCCATTALNEGMCCKPQRQSTRTFILLLDVQDIYYDYILHKSSCGQCLL